MENNRDWFLNSFLINIFNCLCQEKTTVKGKKKKIQNSIRCLRKKPIFNLVPFLLLMNRKGILVQFFHSSKNQMESKSNHSLYNYFQASHIFLKSTKKNCLKELMLHLITILEDSSCFIYAKRILPGINHTFNFQHCKDVFVIIFLLPMMKMHVEDTRK